MSLETDDEFRRKIGDLIDRMFAINPEKAGRILDAVFEKVDPAWHDPWKKARENLPPMSKGN
jgi:hypothetical protein